MTTYNAPHYIKVGEHVRHMDTGRTGVIKEVTDGYNRRGDPCCKCRVFWDDRHRPAQRHKSTWISDYNLLPTRVEAPAIPDDTFIPSNDAERLFGVPAVYNPPERDDLHDEQTWPDIDCEDDYEYATGTGRYAEPDDSHGPDCDCAVCIAEPECPAPPNFGKCNLCNKETDDLKQCSKCGAWCCFLDWFEQDDGSFLCNHCDFDKAHGEAQCTSPQDEPVTMESMIAEMSHDQAYNMWDLANRAFWSGQMEQKHYERICALAKARMAELEDAQ